MADVEPDACGEAVVTEVTSVVPNLVGAGDVSPPEGEEEPDEEGDDDVIDGEVVCEKDSRQSLFTRQNLPGNPYSQRPHSAAMRWANRSGSCPSTRTRLPAPTARYWESTNWTSRDACRSKEWAASCPGWQ